MRQEEKVQNANLLCFGDRFSVVLKEMGLAGAQAMVGSPCAGKGVALTRDSGKLPQKPEFVCFALSFLNKPSVVCTKQ